MRLLEDAGGTLGKLWERNINNNKQFCYVISMTMTTITIKTIMITKKKIYETQS